MRPTNRHDDLKVLQYTNNLWQELRVHVWVCNYQPKKVPLPERFSPCLQKRVFFDIIFWFWNFMLGNASVSDDIDTLSDHRCVHPMFANVRVKTNQKYFGT